MLEMILEHKWFGIKLYSKYYAESDRKLVRKRIQWTKLNEIIQDYG